MTDIVERLRQRDEYEQVLDHLNRPYGLVKSLEHAAADEIDRLRAERDRLRDALTKIATSSKQLPGQMFVAFAREVVTREALKETGHEADE